jgi:hypothetical protein
LSSSVDLNIACMLQVKSIVYLFFASNLASMIVRDCEHYPTHQETA